MATPLPALPLMTLAAPAAVPPMTVPGRPGDVDSVAEVGQRAAAVGLDADVVPFDRVALVHPGGEHGSVEVGPRHECRDRDGIVVVAADDISGGGGGPADGDVRGAHVELYDGPLFVGDAVRDRELAGDVGADVIALDRPACRVGDVDGAEFARRDQVAPPAAVPPIRKPSESSMSMPSPVAIAAVPAAFVPILLPWMSTPGVSKTVMA